MNKLTKKDYTCSMQKRNYFIIFYATILQVVTGIVLLLSSKPLEIAQLGIFNVIFPYKLGAVLMLLSVALVLYADLKIKNKVVNILLHIPQEFFLILTAISGILYISLGHYADGTVRSQSFILVDQLPGIIAAALYLVFLFDFAGGEQL